MLGHPVLQNSRTLVVTAADTNPTRFADLPARLVTLRCRTGSFKIVGVNGESLDSDGVTVAASGITLTLWVTNLNQLGYIAASPSDVLEVVRSW